MAKKKDRKVVVSQADAAQVQDLLGQFHQIARALRSSTDQQEAETALQPITSTSEATQMAVLKLLSKERHSDAADVVIALNELSPIKSVRKEAHRSQLRLEEMRVYPQWQPPVVRTSVVDRFLQEQKMQALNTPSRFWKGVVTDSRDIGEVQLLLMWEQGLAYKEVRVLGFLLEFRRNGIKDFFTRVDSKRSVEKMLAEIQDLAPAHECSLSKGRKLILEALDVNKKRGTQPHSDYRHHLSLINELVLEAPGLSEEEEEDSSDDDSFIDLEPEEVVTSFIQAWIDGDYIYAYSFLSEQSSLREGLSREEWVARREAWASKAEPANLEPGPVYERKPQKSVLWLPNPFSRLNTNSKKEIEAHWSIELNDISDEDSLPEQPHTTAIYEETGRHWFWTSYTLVQEQDDWLIQSMSDEASNAQQLPVAELRRRIEENDKRINQITEQHSPTDADAEQYLEEIVLYTVQAIFYDDALLTQLPHDSLVYWDASARATVMGESERAIMYMERLAENVPEEKARTLLHLAALQIQLSEQYDSEEDEEDEEDYADLSERLREQAEASLRASLQMEDSASGHIGLAELLINNSQDEDTLMEAEVHLRQAEALTSDEHERAMIETKFGEIAAEREQFQQALSHYQRALEIEPTFPNTWYNIGRMYSMLGQTEDAIESYKQGIEADPDDMDAYVELITTYMAEGRLAEARAFIKADLARTPESASLLSLLALTYFDSDPERADELLAAAESSEPNSTMVQLYRQLFNISQENKRSSRKQLPGKKRKKR